MFIGFGQALSVLYFRRIILRPFLLIGQTRLADLAFNRGQRFKRFFLILRRVCLLFQRVPLTVFHEYWFQARFRMHAILEPRR